MTVVPTQVNQLFLGVQDVYYDVRDVKPAVAFYRDVLGCEDPDGNVLKLMRPSSSGGHTPEWNA